jgi:hypothetical protein
LVPTAQFAVMKGFLRRVLMRRDSNVDFRTRKKSVWPHFNIILILSAIVCLMVVPCVTELYRVTNVGFLNRHFRVNSAECCD